MAKKVSIIIPCRNEEKYIGKCMDSIVNSNYDKNFLELFVCDGLSDDGTENIIKEYSEKYSFIKILKNENRTTPFALNIGIKQSAGDIILILGSHAELSVDYIKKSVEILESDPTIGCAGGVLENIIEDTSFKAIANAMSSSFGVGNASFRTGSKEGFVDTVAFGAYKRKVFDKVGYFDEDLIRNQDDEFNFRLIKNNYKIYLSHSIKAKYYVRSSFSKLSKQYYQYGYWKVYANKKHNTITTFRQLIPPFFVLFIILGLAASIFANLILKVYLGGLLFYLLSAFVAASLISAKFSEIPTIVFSFILLHCSYGSGYIAGSWDFYLINKKPSANSTQLTR